MRFKFFEVSLVFFSFSGITFSHLVTKIQKITKIFVLPAEAI